MNPVALEKQWAEALASVVAPVQSRLGTEVDILPAETVVVVDVDEGRNRGGGYWNPKVLISVNTPALTKDPIPLHSETITKVSDWLEDIEAVETALASGEYELRGFHVKTGGNQREGDYFLCSYEITCGVKRRED